MNFNMTVCHLCKGLMSWQDVRGSVYWLPNMDQYELLFAHYYGGFEHRFAHRQCWDKLKEKKRELIRICSFEGEEPRSGGAKV